VKNPLDPGAFLKVDGGRWMVDGGWWMVDGRGFIAQIGGVCAVKKWKKVGICEKMRGNCGKFRKMR